jgi:hypothetical protein
MEAPFIDSVCEASSTFCLRLQKGVLERDQQKRGLATCFQEWIENNSVNVSIPQQVSERNRVSTVAESANTPIPIHFLSSRLQKINLTRGSTEFGSPRKFFDQVADTHGLIWAITPLGLWMAQQPPSAGVYIDAYGKQHGEDHVERVNATSPRLPDQMPPTMRQGNLSVAVDCRSIVLQGQTHTLTRSQAVMFKVLFDASKTSHPDVDKDTLLRAIENETSRVRDTWRGSPLWQKLIVSKRKGTYRLELEGPCA